MKTRRKALKKLRTQGPPHRGMVRRTVPSHPSYFGDIVRREMGITPQAFLQIKLIDRAKSLLAKPGINDQ